MRLLKEARIDFVGYEYDASRGVDAVSVAKSLQKPVEQIFKTLVTEGKPREYFVFVVPACNELNLKKAARAAGQKSVEMLPQKRLLSTTGYIHGGCSPVGMKKLFPTFIDESAILFDTICVSGGKVGVTLELNAEKLANFIGAKFCDLTSGVL